MPYCYSDPKRADEPNALPDVEVFYQGPRDFVEAPQGTWQYDLTLELPTSPHSNLTDCGSLVGYYYAFGFPGCLWDSEPNGPYETEEEAIAAAQGD